MEVLYVKWQANKVYYTIFPYVWQVDYMKFNLHFPS